ncbi:MAG: UpxY family transcription antiterminator [Bacteroidetes bacterium]|nr:UpxY family transcription antiterminator [Bacteroidota bacterium]
MESTKKWLALYTRPRWEKKVYALLTQKGIVAYCPLNKVRRQWSDRVKVVEEPLFKSYVFVQVTEAERAKVRLTQGAVNFIYWNGKPAQIRDKEIAAIKRFLDEHEEVELIPMELKPNQRVIIQSGTFMGQNAQVLELRRRKAKVRIESLGYTLVAYMDRAKLRPINTKN